MVGASRSTVVGARRRTRALQGSRVVQQRSTVQRELRGIAHRRERHAHDSVQIFSVSRPDVETVARTPFLRPAIEDVRRVVMPSGYGWIKPLARAQQRRDVLAARAARGHARPAISGRSAAAVEELAAPGATNANRAPRLLRDRGKQREQLRRDVLAVGAEVTPITGSPDGASSSQRRRVGGPGGMLDGIGSVSTRGTTPCARR